MLMFRSVILFASFASSTKFYFKLAGEPRYVSRSKKDLIVSEVYSPIIFEIKDVKDVSVSLIDSRDNHFIAEDEDEEKKVKISSKGNPKFANFEIVYSPTGYFYIMRNNRCLQVVPQEEEKEDKENDNFVNVILDECNTRNKKLFKILYKGEHIEEYEHVAVPDLHKMNHHRFVDNEGHLHYSHIRRYKHKTSVLDNIGHAHDIYTKTNELFVQEQ